MRDLSEHFDWRDEDGTATSETFDPHVVATVSEQAVSVELGSMMLIVDSRLSVEPGKRLAVEMLRGLMGLDKELTRLAFVLRARGGLGGEGVANTQEKGT